MGACDVTINDPGFAAGADDVSRPEEWSRRAVLNTVGMGPFSSDRSVREYADKIWNIRSVI